jgi:hypothetical protein
VIDHASDLVDSVWLEIEGIHAPWEKGIKVNGSPETPIIERNKERILQADQLSKETMRA